MYLRTITFHFTNLPEGRLALNQYARCIKFTSGGVSLRHSVPTELNSEKISGKCYGLTSLEQKNSFPVRYRHGRKKFSTSLWFTITCLKRFILMEMK